MGHSDALEARLRAAELQRKEVQPAKVTPPCKPPSKEPITAAYRRLMINLQECLQSDISRARQALQKFLGEVRIVAEGDAVYAEIETRADRLLLR